MKTKKITILSLFVAIGLVMQYIEGRILFSSVPGGKLGLANIVSIINIFMFGGVNALAISSVRSILGALLFGGIMTIPYSLSGAVASTLAMWGIKHLYYPKISIVGISIVGAVFNNISQVTVAAFFYQSFYVFSYLPTLFVMALVSGFATGVITHIFTSRTKGILL